MPGIDIFYEAPTGIPPVTQFADTLLRVDDPPCLGRNYFQNQSQASTTSGANLDANVNVDNVNGATFSGPLIAPETFFIPVPVSWNTVLSRSTARGMFAQMTLTQRIAGISGAVGLGVFLLPNTPFGYALTCQSTTGSWNLQQFTVGVVRAAAITTALNDVARLEVRVLSATNVELKCFKNGVLATTDNINPVPTSSPTAGVFGIYYAGGNGSTLSFKNFSGGLL